jgi:general secretion pathway protein H
VRPTRAGLTLIEIMVVIVIVALGASAASMGIGALSKTHLRSACVRLLAVSRYAYHRALTNGTTVRLTLDLQEGTMELSEAEGRVSLVRSDAPLRVEAEREDGVDPGAAVDPWAVARARLDRPDVLIMPPSPFSPIRTPSGKVMDRFKKRPVGEDIRIVRVVVAHEAAPREEGQTDLFFFPSGMTQHAVIQLADRSDTIYSVEIHPLTGRGTVHNVPYEPDVLFDDPTERNSRATQLEAR